MYSRIDYPQYEGLLVITTQVKKENIANTLGDTIYSCSLQNHCPFFFPKVIGYFDFQHHYLFICAYIICIHMNVLVCVRLISPLILHVWNLSLLLHVSVVYSVSLLDNILMHRYTTLIYPLHSTCQQIWKTKQWPQDWKRPVFVPIPKKGSSKECSNHWTIVLISHASKVMLKILHARLWHYTNQELPDVQAGFRKEEEPEIKLPTSDRS